MCRLQFLRYAEIEAPTPPPVEPVESDEESDGSGETDESEPEDIVPPNWTSVLLQFAGYAFLRTIIPENC